MNELIEKTLLFDFYGELLTENQKKIYELHHLDDLSFGEISEQLEISRQGVYDTLKRCYQQLIHYEEKLKLVKQFEIKQDKVNQIYELIVQLKSEKDISKEHIAKYIEPIETIAKSILEDL